MTNNDFLRGVWIGLFLFGILGVIGVAWAEKQPSPMFWFLLGGVWSAVCGIGFTITKWWTDGSVHR